MERTAFLAVQERHVPQKRTIKQVPFVEMFQGRLQGVVSSGSDIKRVYVSFFEASTCDYYCSTNNNRPCGGLNSGHPCKHLQLLLTEAAAQYGVESVIDFLKIPADGQQIKKANELLRFMNGTRKKDSANDVFSRFLNYLRYLELHASRQPIPEMAWFV